MPKPIPFDFVFDYLHPLPVTVKPMFGCHMIYSGNKMLFFVREKEVSPVDNGVSICTSPEHHASLRQIFPNMRSLEIFGPGPTSWQNLPADADDFEESVHLACELIKAGDPRIGREPKSSARKTSQRRTRKSGKKVKSTKRKTSPRKKKNHHR